MELILTTTAPTPTAATTDEKRKIRIYPSSAAFMSGPLVDTTKNSACLRYQWANYHTQPPKIDRVDPAYAGLGALNEERFAAKIRRKRLKYDREVKFTVPYGDDAVFSGRYDFDVHYKTGTVITELKGSVSESVKEAIKTGEPVLEHLAQLVSYMALFKREEGHLWNTYWQLDQDQDGYRVTAERQFVVKLDQAGSILVDGKIHHKSVVDVRRWLQETKAAVSNKDVIPPEPKQQMIEYKSPCSSCPMKKVCAELKVSEQSADRFLEAAKEALSAPVTPRAFKITGIRKKGESDDNGE